MKNFSKQVCLCLHVLITMFSVGCARPPASKAELPSKTDDYHIAAIADLPSAEQGKVDASIKSFLNNKTPTANRDAGQLSWDCFAAIALYENGVNQAKQKLLSIAQQLADDAVRAGDNVIGWRYEAKSGDTCPDGGLDAFGDGTCNGKNTVYSFQTGLGMACLAKAGALLGQKDYIAKASQILSYWQKYTLPKPCDDCVYYLYSDNPNDQGRYVRNVNVFMAYGAAMLGKVSGDQNATNLARQSMRADMDERLNGNEGYLGRLDPEWKANREKGAQNIENHAAAMAVVTDLMGSLDDTREFHEHGLALWDKWANCDNSRCRATSCSVWGGDASKCQATLTAAHCAFRKTNSLANSQCDEYLSRAGSVPSFGLWSVIVGGGQ